MSVTAKCLADAQIVPNADTLLYTAPASTKAIIDKFTATNVDASTHTLTVYIVPTGHSPAAAYTILDATSLTTLLCLDCTQLQNQILNAGDKIYANASAGSSIVVRISGREIVV